MLRDTKLLEFKQSLSAGAGGPGGVVGGRHGKFADPDPHYTSLAPCTGSPAGGAQ